MINARPVLKWAGGKGQLLPELLNRMPATLGAYHEPFAGSAALFFELAARNRLTSAYLSDVNPALMEVYVAIRDCVEEVIDVLKRHPHDETHYYTIRALHPATLTLPERAARVIYLNKTCYNGLYRENRAGHFNVPFGRYKNPTICDEPNLRAASRTLQTVTLTCEHYSSALQAAQTGDFVYFDPPYHPMSSTSNFTAYARHGFGEADQEQLRDVFRELTRRGVNVMLSNSDTPFVRDLYAGYAIARVYAARHVNSKARLRGKVPEVIVCNYVAADFASFPARTKLLVSA